MANLICPKCGGTGKIVDYAVMLSKRVASGKSAKEVASSMGISTSYLCDLEHGRRSWTPEIVANFEKAIK